MTAVLGQYCLTLGYDYMLIRCTLQMVGLAKGALDSAIPYLHEREAFGRKIADFQAMQHMRAKLATEVEAASLMVYNAARLKDQGMPFVKEAAMAKYYTSEVRGNDKSLLHAVILRDCLTCS